MNKYNLPTIMETQRKILFAKGVGILFVLATFFTSTVLTTLGQHSFIVSYEEIDKDAIGKEPITKEGLLRALRRKILPGPFLIQEVQRRGVAFEIDPFDEQQIRRAGSYLIAEALDDLIETIRTNSRSPQETPAKTSEVRTPPPSGESILCLVDSNDPSLWISFDGLRRTYVLKVGKATYRGHYKNALTYNGRDITGPKDPLGNAPNFYAEGDGPEKIDGGVGLGPGTVELRVAARYPSPGPFPNGYGGASLTMHIPPESTWTKEIVINDHKLLGCK